MYDFVNKTFLVLYIALFFLEGGLKIKYTTLKKNYKSLIPLFLFFVLALIASLNNIEDFPFKYLENYLPFFIIPIVFLSQDNFYSAHKESFYKALIYGCAITLILCYSNAVYELITKNEPISYFLRWRHLGHEFTSIAGTHPAYLGLFIVTSLAYLFTSQGFSLKLKIGLIIFFTLGLFQLAGRMAILIYAALILIVFLDQIKKNKKIIGVSVLIISSVIFLLFKFGSNYLTERIFSTNSIGKDYRFERQVVSYEIFKENPINGLGFQKIKNTRIEKYTEHGYIIAAHNAYNAHNQFMEYLSINGVIGGVVYILIFGFFIIKSIREKKYLFAFIFLALIAANITESMLARNKGIVYFTIFATLFLSSLNKGLKEHPAS